MGLGILDGQPFLDMIQISLTKHLISCSELFMQFSDTNQT